MYALVRCELGCDTEVFEVAMEKGVEELWENISPVELEVFLGSETLLRLKVDHTANHALEEEIWKVRKWNKLLKITCTTLNMLGQSSTSHLSIHIGAWL